ncbi:P-II family nitrogen regulator [Marinoscillum furvescens]|uniref:Nitrogen regulatory protein P-II family n=1 Tax=Marinoscillum furvescens DSM 4134 TaxID=1122208 RepID=A0A3D9L1J6_MARFU|nr:P-II family nitrogen regulator [Marinoscillum furvescens]RED97918.1 nitrogen regulatory protein P-II family [Marinoscillum furvescens DSM 4134]
MKLQKIEIIIANSFLQDLIQQLEGCGIHGYTALEIFRGKGTQRGEQLSEGLLPITRNSLVFTITEEKLSEQVIQKLDPFISERGGVLIVTEVTHAIGIS